MPFVDWEATGLNYAHPDIAANLFHDASVHIVPVTTANCLSTLS